MSYIDIKAKIKAARRAGKKVPRGVIRELRSADAAKSRASDAVLLLEADLARVKSRLSAARTRAAAAASDSSSQWAARVAEIDAL